MRKKKKFQKEIKNQKLKKKNDKKEEIINTENLNNKEKTEP